MAENNYNQGRRPASEQAKDYKERFEFRLTVGDYIICQRYFKINNFNPVSLASYELAETLRNCAKRIDEDLIGKTNVYLSYTTPRIFKSEEEMNAYFEKPENCEGMVPGEAIVIRHGADKSYVWGKNGHPVVSNNKFDDSEYIKGLTDEDKVEFKLSFYDNLVHDRKGNVITHINDRGEEVPSYNFSRPHEVCSTVWTGIYPKAVRNQIDLSNRRGKFEGEDINRLSFDQYVLMKMFEGKSDLVYPIIKDLQYVCSADNDEYYTTADKYGKTVYQNNIPAEPKAEEN